MVIIMNQQMLVAQMVEPSELQKFMIYVRGLHMQWKKENPNGQVDNT